MSLAGVRTTVEDPGWPALAEALDTTVMFPFLNQAAGVGSTDAECLRWSAEVLKHKVGRRCTIRYELRERRGACDAKGAIIGKLYSDLPSAARVYRLMGTLRKGLFDTGEAFLIPAPLLLISELGLLLQQHADGADLRHVQAINEQDRVLYLAGQWLAILHATPPPRGLEMKSLEREVGKIDGWCAETLLHLGDDGAAGGVREAQQGLHHLASLLPTCAPALIHRDFYPANVFWDGARVWVLDFDEVSIGDPALDVAHFVAHLENFAHRTGGNMKPSERQGATFLESYLRAGYIDLRLRLPFYKAYTLLKLAAKYARRQQNDWRRLTRMMISRACEEVTSGLREAS